MAEELGAEAPLAGVRTVLQTAATGYIYDPDVTTVVYGFNGWPRWSTVSRPQALQQQRPAC